MKKHVVPALALFGVVLFVVPISGDAAIQANIRVEQLSASEYGVWTMFTASGTTKTSKDPGVDRKAHTFTLTEFGRTTISVTSPPGMAPKISIYRGDTLQETIEVPQYSFDLLPSDHYRFVIQYNLTRVGNLGVTSDPVEVRFRMKCPSGKSYTGKTPHTFSQLPAGKYTVQVQSTTECLMPAPKNAVVQYEKRNTIHITLQCGALKEEQSERIRPTKRSLVEQAEKRELKPIGNRK